MPYKDPEVAKARKKAYYLANRKTTPEDSRAAHLAPLPYDCGVYKITHAPTGCFYIGSSKTVRRRFLRHMANIAGPGVRKYTNQDMARLWQAGRASDWQLELVIVCAPEHLRLYEQACITAMQPPLNRSSSATAGIPKGATLGPELIAKRVSAAKTLWADPEYRAKSIAARTGHAYNKGYKCTPEQVENRRRAARIVHTKRMGGDDWRALYLARYPEHAADIEEPGHG